MGHGSERYFTRIKYDGSEFQQLTANPAGRGHPTFDPEKRYILTDAYPEESLAYGDGTAPVRLIDCQSGSGCSIIRIAAVPQYKGDGEWRLDLHPAWDRSGKMIAFNGLQDNTRRVFVADLSSYI
ncbi:MAG: TolB-like translocation protein [Planctomycetota bacterium]